MNNALFKLSRVSRCFSFGALALVINGILVVAQAYLLSDILDAGFLRDQSVSSLTPSFLLLITVAFSRALFNFISNEALARVSMDLRQSLRVRLHRALLQSPWLAVKDIDGGEVINSFGEGVETFDPWVRQYLPQLLMSAVVPVTVLLVCFPVDWISALIMLITIPLIPVLMILIGSRAKYALSQQWDSMQYLAAQFYDSIRGFYSLKTYNKLAERTRVISESSDEFRRSTMRVLRVAFLSSFALELVATLSTALVAVSIGIRLLHAFVDYRTAMFVLLLAPEFYLPLRLLGAAYHTGKVGDEAAKRIFSLLDELESGKHDHRARGCLLFAEIAPILKVEDLTFGFNNNEKILENVSFEINPGEHIALTGISGVGKSTLLSIIAGLIPCEKVIGTPKLTWVAQKSHHFASDVFDQLDRTLFEELGLEELSTREVRSAGEQGFLVSEGQAQRLALARALNARCSLLLLDEATAALDSASETRVLDYVRLRHPKLAVLHVTHRQSVLAKADRIYQLECGQLKEISVQHFLQREGGLS